MAVPSTMPRGKVRGGPSVSPADAATLAHPSYAHSTPIIATPIWCSSGKPNGAAKAAALTPVKPSPVPSRRTLVVRMAPTLIPVLQFWTLALGRVPRTFTAPTVAIISAATSLAAVGSSATNWRRYPANATASVATDPVEITQNSVQPSRKAGSAPKASRTYAYAPPASGSMAPSSPYVTAPSSASTPPSPHARRAYPTSPPASRSTAPGTRKIPEPIVVPTTMKIRSRKRRVRASEAPGTAALRGATGQGNPLGSNRHAAGGVEPGTRRVSPAPPPEDHMLRCLPVVLTVLAIAPRLAGQTAADARWLAECRDRDDGWRVKHCEVRVSSLKATGDAITADPGENGGGAVGGGGTDSVGGHARI